MNEYIKKNVGYSLYEAQLAGAEAIKRQLKKEKMTMLVSGCGIGKTKIGSAALYAYQKSIGGGRRINVITCPSHVAKKWVRELYETVPDCIARVVSSITDVDRMYELYRTTDKSVFMVLSKESARSGYLRKATVMWNKRRKGFICPVCGAVQEMTVTTDGISYTVTADSIFFREENNKNHKCQSCKTVLWEADNPDCLDPAKNEWQAKESRTTYALQMKIFRLTLPCRLKYVSIPALRGGVLHKNFLFVRFCEVSATAFF